MTSLPGVENPEFNQTLQLNCTVCMTYSVPAAGSLLTLSRSLVVMHMHRLQNDHYTTIYSEYH